MYNYIELIMNLVKTIDQYNDHYVYFCDPIKNNIIPDSIFIRILYSNESVTLNGVYLLINLYEVNIERYYNKFKCSFNSNNVNHKECIESIKIIEENLLKKIGSKKNPQFKIYEQFKNNNIKIFNDVSLHNNNTCSFILKISGIWETEENYGLTYKFININNSSL